MKKEIYRAFAINKTGARIQGFDTNIEASRFAVMMNEDNEEDYWSIHLSFDDVLSACECNGLDFISIITK